MIVGTPLGTVKHDPPTKPCIKTLVVFPAVSARPRAAAPRYLPHPVSLGPHQPDFLKPPDHEVRMNGLPLGKITGQGPPLAACAQKVQHSAENFVQVHFTRCRFLASALQQCLDFLELPALDITWVTFSHRPSFSHFVRDLEQALRPMASAVPSPTTCWIVS